MADWLKATLIGTGIVVGLFLLIGLGIRNSTNKQNEALNKLKTKSMLQKIYVVDADILQGSFTKSTKTVIKTNNLNSNGTLPFDMMDIFEKGAFSMIFIPSVAIPLIVNEHSSAVDVQFVT